MIRFKQKDFSIWEDTFTGAKAGAALGAIGGYGFKSFKFRKRDVPIDDIIKPKKREDKSPGKTVEATNERKIKNEELKIVGYGICIGAALGFLVGSVKAIGKKINRFTTVDARLMEKVVSNLKKDGFREGDQFTRDAREATRKKSKVCIVVSSDSGEVKVGINTVNEPKLKSITDNMVRNFKNVSVENTKVSDKFNDITISTISDGSADAGFISGIASSYIHAGYTVYLVEVG